MIQTFILLGLFIILLFILGVVIRRDIQLFNAYWEKHKLKNDDENNKDNVDKM